jgi:prephenate dehydrogenase
MIETVAIAGVGLIGSSFALALRRRVGFRGRILGVSRPEYLEKAVAAGIIDEGVSLEEAASTADFLYLSSSITRIIETLGDLDPMARPGLVVTDAGSTKEQIMAKAGGFERAVFVGGHPMAGKESRGCESADPDLFEGRPYFLCYQSESHKSIPAVAEFRAWLDAFGVRVQEIRAEEHDRLVALTSHLAQMASTALAATLDRRLGAEQARRGAGPGLESMLRLAQSGYEGLWEDILATNSGPIASALDFYISELQRLRRAAGDEVADTFTSAGEFARQLRDTGI